LKLGVKRSKDTFLSEEGALQFSEESNKFIPNLSSYSSISLGFDIPRKKTIKEYCSFLNCYEKVNNLLKIDFSGMFYIDQFKQNIQSEIAYEQKIGRLPVSISASMAIAATGYSTFKPTNEQILFEVPNVYTSLVQKFENEQVYKTDLRAILSTELRFYPLQSRQVLEGKAQQGLHGVYVGLYVNKKVLESRWFENDEFINPVWDLPHTLSWGPSVGFQKKIAKKHFIDVGAKIGDTTSTFYSIGKVNFVPYFKFGYAF
jgi:hypothetical protein